MIPDEAVEAAVAAAYGGEDLPEKLGEFGAEVRMILEAAAPYLMEHAWDEGEDAGQSNAYAYSFGGDVKSNPYRPHE